MKPAPWKHQGRYPGRGQISNSGAWAGTERFPRVACGASVFWTYHRTLLQVWVAPSGEPATMGTWMGLCCMLVTRSRFSSRGLQVALRACNLASMLSNHKHRLVNRVQERLYRRILAIQSRLTIICHNMILQNNWVVRTQVLHYNLKDICQVLL